MSSLTQDQRETIALVQLKLVESRQQLLDAARGTLAFKVVPIALFFLEMFAVILRIEGRELILFCSVVLFLVIQAHALFLNSRINALIALLEEDLTRAVFKPS